MEIWDLYDENKNVTGKYCLRGDEIPENFYHLVVHVWIKNDKGEYLISQRAEDRPTFPLMWECVGGSVLKGENSIQGAIRETKEEVGIDLEKIEGSLVYSKVRKIENKNNIMDVWLFKYNGVVELENATTNEVSDVKWMTKEQIRELFETNKLVRTLDYFFKDINI